ncbi:MAG: N-acetylmuramoyl-L-alanine amidase [Lachnospiraceae bacterium]|nr:N-acetylmuramoyl-L-alanine amidase [Lachnospiraceae bacterium]
MKRKNRKSLRLLLLLLMTAAVGLSGCMGEKRLWTEAVSGSEAAQSMENTLETEESTVQTALQGTEGKTGKETEKETENETEEKRTEEAVKETEKETAESQTEETENENSQKTKKDSGDMAGKSEVINWNPDWKYAENSRIHTGSATLYYTASSGAKGMTVCINAGHGTSGGFDVYTLCHPDGSPKVTGGSTAKGQTKAAAVSGGTTMDDGTPEAAVTLKLALVVKERLLEEGYNVLMIRENDDVQLDNIARTVIANQYADCHIALHYDSTESDKGTFYIGVPDEGGYRSMEPVASHWQDHERLGSALIDGMRQQGVKIFGDGSMDIDLTQTSYSTIPSVDLEIGDRASDYSEETLEKLAAGIAAGLNSF